MKHSIAVTLIMTMAAGLANAQDKRPFKAPTDINFRTGNIMSEGTRMQAEVFTPKDTVGKLPRATAGVARQIACGLMPWFSRAQASWL